MGGNIKLKKGVLPHKFDCQRLDKAPSSTKHKIRFGRKKKVDMNQNMDTTDESSTAPLTPIEWVDCGAASLSDTEYLFETEE